MHEYLAGTCAKAGERVDRELLASAGIIIQALINGGPADNIDDYEDAPFVIDSYLGEMKSSAETIADFLTIISIRDFLNGEDSSWSNRYDSGWSPEQRVRFKSTCDSILERPECKEHIEAELTSKDDFEFASANEAAKAIGIDTWDLRWQRLQEKPSDQGRWFDVTFNCHADRIDMVLEFAEKSIDLASIATGASDEMGLGPEFEQHSCLSYVLQELHRFPGKGVALIQAGLKSPVIRNRLMAIGAIAGSVPVVLTNEQKAFLEAAAESDPDEGVRDNIKRLLSGEPLWGPIGDFEIPITGDGELPTR